MTRTTIISEPTLHTTTDAEGSGDGGRSTSAGRWRWAVLLVVVAAVVAAILATSAGGEEASDEPATSVLTTATVQRRDIVSTTTVEGTLTYTDSRTVTADMAGTVTALPEVGATVQPGEPLYAVDGVPVVLIPGELPLWRELSIDSDPGQDVTVLEQALVDLGHADPDLLTVDDTFTDVTADAVEAFREAVGLAEGDSLNPGEVAVLPGAVRIAGHDVQLGDGVQPGAAMLTVTGTDRVVTVDLAAGDQDLLSEGDAVEVDLPDGSTASGTVTYVSPVAEARTSSGQNAETQYVIPAEITLSSGGETFDEAPVDVVVSDEVATGVLAVPVEAVLALAEGGYALEVIATDGTTSMVAVTLGDFADGWVEVIGSQIAEGTEVVSA